MADDRFPSEDSLRTIHEGVEWLIWSSREQIRNEPDGAMHLVVVRSRIADVNSELAFVRRESKGKRPARRIGSGWPRGVNEAIKEVEAAMKRLRRKWQLGREISTASMFHGGIGDNVAPVLDAEDHDALLSAMNALRLATGDDEPTIMEKFDAEMERYRSRGD